MLILKVCLFFLLVIIASISIFFKTRYKFWKKLGVNVAVKPKFLVGNLADFFRGRSSAGEIMKGIYEKCEGPYTGMYLIYVPVLLVKDVDIIKNILVKDFNNFSDRGVGADVGKEPLLDNLFMIKGQRWKHLRHKLTPIFTSGKLKMMFQTILECGNQLQSALQPLADNNEDVEMRDFVGRYTTDIISSVAFGIKTNSVFNKDSEFRKYGKKLFQQSFYASIISGFFFLAPQLLNYLPFKVIAEDITNFFTNALKETVVYREKNNVTRNDFLQMLIELKNKGQVDSNEVEGGKKSELKNDCLSFNQILAQSFLFFVAGFETSSSTMDYCLYELAIHPEIQKKVQKDIDQVLAKSNEEITYDSIIEMDYLDNVVSETLRKYPILESLNRICTKDYTISKTNLLIKEGTNILISVRGLHYDPENFKDPEKFDPDRFLPENKNWNPFCYLPFGEGPRNCIGARMGRMQTKVGLVSILKKFNVDVCKRTQIPMKFNVQHMLLIPKMDIILKISNR